MEESPIIFERRGQVAYITLNRPERMNSFSEEMHTQLRESWATVRDDDNIWVAIVTGAGERAFSAGMDVKAAASGSGPKEKGRSADVNDRDLTAIHNKVWKPVITAVNGVCAGGGLHFVADSDITICAEHATFLDPHVSVGQVSALEPIGLTRRIPMELVLRMALVGRGERLNAQDALRIGLVSEVVPKDKLMSRATEIAEMLCQNSLAAMMATKRAIWQSLEYGLHDGLQNGWDILRAHWDHPDYKEGPKAFNERRPPLWTV